MLPDQAVKGVRLESGLDIVICLTETWHEHYDAVPIFKHLRSEGLQVLERARPIPATAETDTLNFTDHGLVAIVYPTNIRLEK